jgi:hypothetical protein
MYIQYTDTHLVERIKNVLKMAGIPALFAFYLAIKNTYNIFKEGSYIDHASGGNKLDNLVTLFKYTTNWSENMIIPYCIFCLFLMITLLKKQIKDNKYVYWAFISFIFSLLIPVSTKFAADFYAITPSAYWIIFIGLLLQVDNNFLFQKNSIVKNILIIYIARACFLMCALYALWGFQYTFNASTNITKSFQEIERSKLDHLPISIYYPQGIFFAYKFYEQGKIDWLFKNDENGVLDHAKFVPYTDGDINLNNLPANDYVLDWNLNIIPRLNKP